MEPKLIFWIIGLIIYFWIRSKKSNVPGNPEQEPGSAPPSSPGKPMTFEDLLREIEQAKQPAKEIPKKAETSYEEFEEEEIREEVIPETVKPQWQYKPEAIEETIEAEVTPTKAFSLEETLKRGTVDTNAPKFKEYEIVEENVLAKSVASDLNDPEKLKKAFIMSEILNRKWS